MADIVGKVEKTARDVLRRGIQLLAQGLALGEQLAARLRRKRPSHTAAWRETPLNHVQEEAAGQEGEGAVVERAPLEAPSPEREVEAISSPLSEGHMVARVMGEEEVHAAPIPLAEEKLPPPEAFAPGPPPLPSAYHDDAFVALARDPFTLWLYWDFAPETVREAMEGLRSPRTKLRIYQGAHRVRDIDFALESGSYYINDLSPGERYEAEIVVIGENGERRLGRRSNSVALPHFGPSSWAEDRFATLPIDTALPQGLDAFERPLPPELEEELAGRWGSLRQGASEAWPRRRPSAGSGSFLQSRIGREEG